MVKAQVDDLSRRMDSTLEALKKEFSSLRTGRASASMIEPVMVDVYGSMMPLNQVGTISVPEPRMISVQVWDKGNAKAVEKAIREAGLGLNPQGDGQTIRVPVPELNQERRKELVKVANRYSEEARVAVRNVRRDGMDKLKKMNKDGDLTEDELKTWSDKVQAMTDSHIKKIDESFATKEKEIMQI